jgi:glyoxylase-like metal-dependent hydrolase (beta-lactamase superfamily II)
MPWPHIGHTNAYAIDRDDGGVVLVDCGPGGHHTTLEALDRALAMANRSIADVRELVITHFHSDHMGAIAHVAQSSGCVVSGHPNHSHFFDAAREPERTFGERRALARDHGTPASWLDAAASVAEETLGIDAPVEPSRPLVDGAEVESALGRWEVIETPGHAPSQICLVQRERRLLIVADLVSKVFGSYADLGYTPDPIGEYLTSLKRIGDLDAALALPGHGRPINDLAPVIALYQEGINRRLRDVLGVLREGPRTAWDAALALFGTQQSEAVTVWSFLETVGYVQHLELAGQVRRNKAGVFGATDLVAAHCGAGSSTKQ